MATPAEVDIADHGGNDTQMPGAHTSNNAFQSVMNVQAKYEQERQKRLRLDGDAQYIDLALSEKFKHYREDPWLDERSEAVTIKHGEHVKFLILGAGLGGLVFAAKLIQTAGVAASEIRLVDAAGGIGGTWYYNRPPGLMCDVESYCYLPLLEEMQYVPKHKYSYSHEIRAYLNAVADKYGLSSTAMFRTTIKRLVWDETKSQWNVSMRKERGRDPDKQTALEMAITAEFVIATSGLLVHPKLPGIADIDKFEGVSFHTSRWDYSATGGSPSDANLHKLADKRVGIIGTGATAIQAVPHLARHAKHLTVFQRTPSSVDTRGQHATDPETFALAVATHRGWWRERNVNLASHLSDAVAVTDTNLVDDQWSRCHSYRALIGGPSGPRSPADVPDFLASLHAMDLARAERLRRRVDEVVVAREKQTAARALKPWYASWCKRPAFHDEYLATFNLARVDLVDTDGRGVDALTRTGARVGDTEYPLDMVIFSTGFRAPWIGSPAHRAGMTVTGREGMDLDAKWNEEEQGLATLHGCMTHGFPNFFMPGPFQAAATANQSFTLDVLGDHVAQIIRQAQERVRQQPPGRDGDRGSSRVVIEPTREAEEAWAAEIAKRSISFAGVGGCTPGYLNGEGAMARITESSPEEMMKAARRSIWGEGIVSFMRVLERWEADGELRGLDVKVVP